MIIKNVPVFDDINSILPEAQLKYDELSKVFEKHELYKLAENLANTEPALAIALGSIIENIQLNEFIVKKVNAQGDVARVQDSDTRKRKAFQTTGLSSSERRRIALKSAKTKKSQPSKKSARDDRFRKALLNRKRKGFKDSDEE